MRTKEELDALKEKTETMNNTLAELTDDELETVLGGLIGNGGMEMSNCMDAQSAVVITAKTAGILTQISGFCISVSNTNSEMIAVQNSVLDSFTEGIR